MPSLKPIGLNAMLTCDPYRSYSLSVPGSPTAAPIITYRPTSRPPPPLVPLNSSSSSSAAAGLGGGSRKSSRGHSHGHGHGGALVGNRENCERALVKHLRHTLPLMSLKELADEIGFVEADLCCYRHLLHMNVMAPRLFKDSSKRIEDTHSWGQEETRRRGTLQPHRHLPYVHHINCILLH